MGPEPADRTFTSTESVPTVQAISPDGPHELIEKTAARTDGAGPGTRTSAASASESGRPIEH